MNLSFAGCGYLGIYHVGVASCFRQYAPHVLDNKITGASVGALIACGMMLNVPLGISTNDVLRISLKAQSRALGPFHPGFDIIPLLREGIQSMLPDDAYHRCSGKLHISVTRVSDGENVLLNTFESNEDLVQALMCSCFIPLYCGLIPPKFHGVGYMDGGFSDNQPVLDDKTITVAPFCGESDICPLDNNFSIMQISLANTSISITPGNMYRFARILFPGHPEMLSQLCQQGFDDALRFLQTNNMISCTRCLAVQSSFLVSEKTTEDVSDCTDTSSTESDSDTRSEKCVASKACRHSSLNNMPETMVKVLTDTCDKMNKGVINWLFRHRSVKLLSLLTLPYVLPIDVTIVFIYKLWKMMPKVQSRLSGVHSLVRDLIKKLICHQKYSAKLSCQMAVMEFDYTTKSSLPGKVGHKRISENRTSEIMQTVEELSVEDHPDIAINIPFSKDLEIRDPERVISNVKLDLTLDLPIDHTSGKSKRHKVMQALKNLGGPGNGVKAVGVANQALSWKRGSISSYGEMPSKNADPLEEILDLTSKQEALMRLYYMDDDMRVKVTEIFNISENADQKSGCSRFDSSKDCNSPITTDPISNEESQLHSLHDHLLAESNNEEKLRDNEDKVKYSNTLDTDCIWQRTSLLTVND